MTLFVVGLSGAALGVSGSGAGSATPTTLPSHATDPTVTTDPTASTARTATSVAEPAGSPRQPATTRVATTAPRPTSPTMAVSASPRQPAFPGLFPVWSWETLARQEQAMADGHQPWVTSPEMVADAYLAGLYPEGWSVGPWAPSGTDTGRFSYTAGRVTGSVRLTRPALSSVWVVVSSSADRLGVTGAESAGGLLRLSVTSTAAGTVTVLAGPFASEWSCHESRAVEPGGVAQFTLRFGDDAVSHLVRVRHEAAGGAVALAERRADGG